MPKIRTYTVNYTITPNRHSLDVNIMYAVDRKIFYVIPPKDFNESIKTMPDDLKEKYNIISGNHIKGVYGWVIANESESILTDSLAYIFHYCGNAIKTVRNVIIVWCKGTSSIEEDKYSRYESNKEAKEIKQTFKFILAIETKIGIGKAVYTYQNVTYTNTISVGGYQENPIVIDDTPENRLFLEDVYAKFDNLVINLAKFFESSETVLQLITSNQKLLG